MTIILVPNPRFSGARNSNLPSILTLDNFFMVKMHFDGFKITRVTPTIIPNLPTVNETVFTFYSTNIKNKFIKNRHIFNIIID